MSAATPTQIELVDAFGAGIYLLMLITHADLWWHRRGRSSHFWLATSAMGALIVNLSGAVVRRAGGDVHHGISALNMLGIALALVSLFELAQSIAGQRSTRLVRILQIGTLLPALATLALGPSGLDAVLYVMSLLFLIAAMIRSIRFARSGDSESRALAIGLTLLLVTLIYDMLSELKWIARIDGTPVLGFSILFITAARALSLRYDREHRELVGLRGELESRVQRRTRELEAANRQLDALSRTDPLTGLANRRSFIATATERIQSAPSALLMIDIDHFKRINDNHGHEVGDGALCAVARALTQGVSDAGLLARWGGEEFIVLLPEPGAAAMADALRLGVEQIALRSHGIDLAITASFGLVRCGTGRDLDERIAAADRALYQAKQQGRNRVVVATD
ncbi:MAG: GGDEF domain-containing protein [Xanthomonadales bacterium]|nr:GGDEF domain-containing protein [Xanthomonadales bacterium]